jgi:hypothetical protein
MMVAVTVLTGAASSAAHAEWLRASGAYVQLGQARETRTWSAGLTWDWQRRWQWQRIDVSGYWEVAAGRWSESSGGERDQALVTQVGITPVFRLRPGSANSHWFAEFGIGANVIAPLYSGNHRRFATAFNFGDHVALGMQLGNRRSTEVALRLQHFSNAGIKRPNPGENFWQLRFSWQLD